MEQALAAGDAQSLEQTAHALKGVAATIGAVQLAELAGKIEKLSRLPEGRKELPELLAGLSSLLGQMVVAIETMRVKEENTPPPPAQAADAVTVERLAPLFQRAVRLLLGFDSAVEGVVKEIAALVGTPLRRERMQAIQGALDAYNFEKCLLLFRAWAEEEGVLLEDDPS
ncbi:MAG: Hpt domain-containing protein [Magnetococcus sp. XQGC-1]